MTDRQAATRRRLADSDALQARLWATTMAAVAARRDDVASSFLQSMNTTIDLAAMCKAARLAHVPARAFVILMIYVAISAATLGHISGGGRRGSTAILMVLLATAFTLILDIDASNRGGVAESQEPMRDLKAVIAAGTVTPGQ